MNRFRQWLRQKRRGSVRWRDERRFKTKRLPYYADRLKYWGVSGPNGIEKGALVDVVERWLPFRIEYHFHTAKCQRERCFSFDAVLQAVAAAPLTFSYRDFEAEYSAQQLARIDQVQRQYTVLPDPKRWAGFDLPKVVTGALIEGNFMFKFRVARDYARIFRDIQPPFSWYHHDQLILIPEPTPIGGRWDITFFGERFETPGNFVLCFHCDDPAATPKVISALHEDEYQLLSQNIRCDGAPINAYADVSDGLDDADNYRFTETGLIYRYHTAWLIDNPNAEHAGSMEAVLTVLVHDPKSFSISGYEVDYNSQERELIAAVLKRYLQSSKGDLI